MQRWPFSHVHGQMARFCLWLFAKYPVPRVGFPPISKLEFGEASAPSALAARLATGVITTAAARPTIAALTNFCTGQFLTIVLECMPNLPALGSMFFEPRNILATSVSHHS